MVARWAQVYDTWVSSPLTAFDGTEMDAESRLFASESQDLGEAVRAPSIDERPLFNDRTAERPGRHYAIGRPDKKADEAFHAARRAA